VGAGGFAGGGGPPHHPPWPQKVCQPLLRSVLRSSCFFFPPSSISGMHDMSFLILVVPTGLDFAHGESFPDLLSVMARYIYTCWACHAFTVVCPVHTICPTPPACSPPPHPLPLPAPHISPLDPGPTIGGVHAAPIWQLGMPANWAAQSQSTKGTWMLHFRSTSRNEWLKLLRR